MLAKGALAIAIVFALAARNAAADPARTLVYAYSFDERVFGGDPELGEHGLVNENAQFQSSSRKGRITITVIGPVEDGGSAFEITQTVDRAPRPLQSLRCSAYGHTTDIVCDEGLRPTPEVVTLLTYLGPFFYAPERLDDKAHWRATPIVHGNLSIDNDFTVTKTEGAVITLKVGRRESGAGYLATTTGTARYDTAAAIPEAVTVTTATQRAGTQGDLNVDLHLESDSTNSH